jgi:hypothetical protein
MKKTVATMKVGKFTLTEKDIYINGEFVDTICEVKYKGGKAVYCNINDAMAHKCEWFEE